MIQQEESFKTTRKKRHVDRWIHPAGFKRKLLSMHPHRPTTTDNTINMFGDQESETLSVIMDDHHLQHIQSNCDHNHHHHHHHHNRLSLNEDDDELRPSLILAPPMSSSVTDLQKSETSLLIGDKSTKPITPHSFKKRRRKCRCRSSTKSPSVTPTKSISSTKPCATLFNNVLKGIILLTVLLIIQPYCVLFGAVECRHYIAPGPCTWTHVQPSHSLTSRDISSSSSSTGRLQMFKSGTPSSDALMNGLSSSSSSTSSSTSEFDVSLRCTVPILTPYTLNLSLIDSQHTVRLVIQCYEPAMNGASSFIDQSPALMEHQMNGLSPSAQSLKQSIGRRKSSLMLQHHHHQMSAPFEHLRSLQSLAIDNCLLDRIPSDTFRGLSSLKNLTIKLAAPTASDNDNDDDGGESLVVEPHSFRHVESSLEHLDLSENQISSLPTDFFCPFLVLHTLNLSGNHLMDLASFGLIDPATGRLCLQELALLDLSNNRLEFVPETSGVAALKHLQHLNLSSNRITEITELAFSALRRLHVLDLSGNRLRTLPARMFRDSDELRELHLGQNGLIELPQGLFQGLSKLQVLTIAGNQITSDTLSTETFADLIRVIVLDMSNNRLRRLGASIFENQYSLQVLSLERNELETIDEGAFSTLYNLHTLKLSGNRFRHLPESVLTGLFVLNELSLAHNQLEHMHEDAFKNCTNLQILDVSSNRLTTIPSAIHSLNKLHVLNLSGNKFTTLTDSSHALIGSSIRRLHLSDNYLVNVSRNALRPLAKTLQELYLDGNRLRQLEKDTFADLRNTLRVLRLDRNEFSTDLNVNGFVSFKQLDRLQVLNISRNDLQRFDYSLIVPNGLRVLDVSWNRLETLTGPAADVESRLEELYGHGNLLKELSAQSIPNSIRVLTVQKNRIEKIDQFTFVAKHNVTYVDLRDNHLRRIDNNAFRLGVQRPTTGHYLSGASLQDPQTYLNSHMNHNQLEPGTLPPPVFMISGNPYYCDCTMEWLQRVNQLAGAISGSGTISTYPRIGDLELVECELPFSRQANVAAAAAAQSVNNTASSASGPSTNTGTGLSLGRRIPLLQANSSNFLCRYRSHCFALCHCCEFDACDCEMMCPENCTCYYDQTWNTNIVDCSGGRYQQVPVRIPMDVTSLYLDGNHLQSLNAHTFIGRKNLRILHLNHSLVETISNRSFNGLVYLEELHLEHNLLTALYGYEFELLHYLTTLNLDHNRLTYIHERTFQPLRSLQTLRLDHNYLTTMGQWFAFDTNAMNPSMSHHHHHHHHHTPPHSKLQLTLGDNPWSCQCSSISSMYETIYQLRQRIILVDGSSIRCNSSTNQQQQLFTGQSANQLIDQCNLTRQYYSLLNTPSSSHSSPSMSGTTLPNNNNMPPPSQEDGAGASMYFPPTQATYSPPTPPPNHPFQMGANSNNNFDSIYHRQPQPPPSAIQPDDENDPDLTYQPIDLMGGTGLRPKLLPPTGPGGNNANNPSGGPYNPNGQPSGYGPHFSSSPSINSPNSPGSSSNSSNSKPMIGWFWLLVIPLVMFILVAALLITVRHKQDIQLWFYGRYGIRLFESGLFSCFGSDDVSSGSGSVSSSRARRRAGRNGFADTYVRDSEKLFDAFVIYARQDESFVAQQLAAELECGYPPYRLCLRYRDLPAPANVDSLTASPTDGGPTGLASATKDHGYAFDAVTQAIECSRRTLVVISEQFLQSEWCKFELKAAHQETLTSCKTHRLIVVVVPSQQTPAHMQTSDTSTGMSSSTNNNNNNNPPNKQAESLLQRLDSETKTCIRGVTILTWQERRFWEKLRFAMPASSTIGGGGVGATSVASSAGIAGNGGGSSSGVIGLSGSIGAIGFNTLSNRHHHSAASGGTVSSGHPVVCDNLKGRTSTVVVTTNHGYPTLAPSSLSSSSSLARSSVLYDSANNPMISSSGGGGGIYGGSGHHYHYAQLPSNNQSTMSLHKLAAAAKTNTVNVANSSNQSSSPVIRNPFNLQVKPLPPPPNQPLPPLPLQGGVSTGGRMIGTFHHQQQQTQLNESQQIPPPPYVEYSNQQQQPQLALMIDNTITNNNNTPQQQQLELTLQDGLDCMTGPIGPAPSTGTTAVTRQFQRQPQSSSPYFHQQQHRPSPHHRAPL